VIDKSQAGYIHRSGDYTCGLCVFAKPISIVPMEIGKEWPAACALFGPGERISVTRGGCNDYWHGVPNQTDYLNVSSKLESGYLEHKRGFGCRRCEHFSPAKQDCSEVLKDSPGDDPGQIHPGACCRLWEEDSKRGDLPLAELQYLIAQSQKRP
jgi:hypothetical protein